LEPYNRLGANGPNEVKLHVWLKDVDWKSLKEKLLETPLIVNVIKKVINRFTSRTSRRSREKEAGVFYMMIVQMRR
jgi:hypothetical protein